MKKALFEILLESLGHVCLLLLFPGVLKIVPAAFLFIKAKELIKLLVKKEYVFDLQYSKLKIAFGFITGTIATLAAEYIGMEMLYLLLMADVLLVGGAYIETIEIEDVCYDVEG